MSVKDANQLSEKYEELNNFFNSYQMQFISNFFSLKYEEVYELFEKNFNIFSDAENLIKNIQEDSINVIIDKFFKKMKPKINGLLEKTLWKNKKYVSEWTSVFDKRIIEKELNSIPKQIKEVLNIVKEFSAEALEKRIAITITSIANPIGEVLNFIDFLVGAANLLSTLTIDIFRY